MTTLFAKTAGGNWTAAGTWSNVSSAGVDNSGPPLAGDDVVFDALSGPVTINAAAVCRSADYNGYTGTLTHNAFTLSIGDATAGLGNRALRFVAGMTYTRTSATTSAIAFVSTSATQQTCDFAGKTTGNLSWNGATGSWILSSAVTGAGNATTFALNRGTLNTNNQAISTGTFVFQGANARTLTLGSSAITISGTTSNAMRSESTTLLTMTANTAVATLTGANGGWNANTFNYNGLSVVIQGSGAPVIGTGTPTVANFTRTGTAVKTDQLQMAAGITCTGTFLANGQSVTNRVVLASATPGTAATITAAVVGACTNLDFKDITVAGAGNWNLSAIGGGSGDCKGNTGVTFTPAAAQAATGTASFTWSTHGWTTRVPLPQDPVTIANAFVAGRTVTIDMPRLGVSLDFTGVTGSPAVTFTAGQPIELYGNLTLAGALGVVTLTSGLLFTATGTATFTSNSNTTAGSSVNGVSVERGTLTLGDAFNSSGFLNAVTVGILNTASKAVSCLSMILNTSSACQLGTSVITLTSTATFTIYQGNGNVVGKNAELVVGTASANTRSIDVNNNAGDGIGKITYKIAGSTGGLSLIHTATVTIGDIEFSDANNARTLTIPALTAGFIFTQVGQLHIRGTAGKLMNLVSGTPGSPTGWIWSTGGGGTQVQKVIEMDFVSLTDQGLLAITNGSAYAGANSVDGGGNSISVAQFRMQARPKSTRMFMGV